METHPSVSVHHGDPRSRSSNRCAPDTSSPMPSRLRGLARLRIRPWPLMTLSGFLERHMDRCSSMTHSARQPANNILSNRPVIFTAPSHRISSNPKVCTTIPDPADIHSLCSHPKQYTANTARRHQARSLVLLSAMYISGPHGAT